MSTPLADPVEHRRSPLHERHVAAGASFTDFAGWDMPVRYAGDLAEHAAVRGAAGLFDLSHMAEIVVIGPGAAGALDHALSTRVSALEVGRAKYSLLLSASGGVLDDLVVYRTGDDRFLVVANAGNRRVAADALVERAAAFDCVVEDESEDVALIAVQGPAALRVLVATPGFALEGGHLTGDDVAEAFESLKYYRALAGSWMSHPVLLARTGYTGEDGFELYLAPEVAPELWDALLEAGAPLGLVPAGLAARDTLRLEAGMPLHGHELSADILPAQAGLGRVVDLGKDDDFVGRAALQAASGTGTEDRTALVGLIGDGRRAARAGYEVFSPEGVEPVGRITSGALSPTLGRPVAMAFVDPRLTDPGTDLVVDVRGTRIPFTVTALPFYRRSR